MFRIIKKQYPTMALSLDCHRTDHVNLTQQHNFTKLTTIKESYRETKRSELRIPLKAICCAARV